MGGEEGGGGAGSTFITCLQILLFLNNCSFLQTVGGAGQVANELVIFLWMS